MFDAKPFSRLIRCTGAGTALVALALAAGCTYSHGEPAPCDISSQRITYVGVISPIFDAHCRECHATNNAAVLGGGNDFGSYQSVTQYPERALLGSIEHTPGYDPMPKNRDKVSDCDIARIKAWMAAGKPER